MQIIIEDTEYEKKRVLKPFNLIISFDNIDDATFFHDHVLIKNKFKNQEEEEKYGDFMPELIGKFFNRIANINRNNFK
jgi:hypothetical protein